MTEFVPLAFGFEALFPPTGMSPAHLRGLYNRLAEPCRFSEFRQLGEGQGARLAEGANRHLTLASDRLIYRDEFTQSLFSTYGEDVRRMLRDIREVFQISVLLHSKVLIRMLMPHGGAESTLEYFQRNLLANAAANMPSFGRPASGVGLRLVFPPSQEHRSTFHLRLEPYIRDQKMFFLENSAQFFDPIVNVDDVQAYLDSSYEFLKEKAGPFVQNLSQPDR